MTGIYTTHKGYQQIVNLTNFKSLKLSKNKTCKKGLNNLRVIILNVSKT